MAFGVFFVIGLLKHFCRVLIVFFITELYSFGHVF